MHIVRPQLGDEPTLTAKKICKYFTVKKAKIDTKHRWVAKREDYVMIALAQKDRKIMTQLLKVCEIDDLVIFLRWSCRAGEGAG